MLLDLDAKVLYLLALDSLSLQNLQYLSHVDFVLNTNYVRFLLSLLQNPRGCGLNRKKDVRKA